MLVHCLVRFFYFFVCPVSTLCCLCVVLCSFFALCLIVCLYLSVMCFVCLFVCFLRGLLLFVLCFTVSCYLTALHSIDVMFACYVNATRCICVV